MLIFKVFIVLISLKLIIIYILLYFNIIILGSACKERWESLRSQYRKYQNKQKTKSGLAASNIFNWKYTNQMHFLNEFMKDRSRITSMTDGNGSDDIRLDESTNECEEEDNNKPLNQNNEENTDGVVNEEITLKSNLKTSKLRKKVTHTDTKESASTTLMKYLVQQKKEENPPHPIDSFFSLMATSVKNFNAVDQHFVKTQLFSLVSDIQIKYIQSQNQRTFQPKLTNSEDREGFSNSRLYVDNLDDNIIDPKVEKWEDIE